MKNTVNPKDVVNEILCLLTKFTSIYSKIGGVDFGKEIINFSNKNTYLLTEKLFPIFKGFNNISKKDLDLYLKYYRNYFIFYEFFNSKNKPLFGKNIILLRSYYTDIINSNSYTTKKTRNNFFPRVWSTPPRHFEPSDIYKIVFKELVLFFNPFFGEYKGLIEGYYDKDIISDIDSHEPIISGVSLDRIKSVKTNIKNLINKFMSEKDKFYDRNLITSKIISEFETDKLNNCIDETYLNNFIENLLFDISREERILSNRFHTSGLVNQIEKIKSLSKTVDTNYSDNDDFMVYIHSVKIYKPVTVETNPISLYKESIYIDNQRKFKIEFLNNIFYLKTSIFNYSKDDIEFRFGLSNNFEEEIYLYDEDIKLFNPELYSVLYVICNVFSNEYEIKHKKLYFTSESNNYNPPISLNFKFIDSDIDV